MNPHASHDATSPAPQPRPDVRLVGGHLSETELAALTAAVAAVSVASRELAHERELAQSTTGASSCWGDATQRHPRAHGLRSHPGPGAWQFSDR